MLCLGGRIRLLPGTSMVSNREPQIAQGRTAYTSGGFNDQHAEVERDVLQGVNDRLPTFHSTDASIRKPCTNSDSALVSLSGGWLNSSVQAEANIKIEQVSGNARLTDSYVGIARCGGFCGWERSLKGHRDSMSKIRFGWPLLLGKVS